MTYDPYSIIVIPFPFTDNPIQKKRPALVISSKEHQKQTNHVSLLMITSAKHSAWDSDYPINDAANTGLSAPSIIRQKIFSIDSRLIINKIGNISKKDKEQVIVKLKEHLDF